MKINYKDFDFRDGSLKIITEANNIIETYEAQGYDLTLRQLYYQFVARGLLENTERNYKRLGNIINDGRLAGLIDWEAITDRTRMLRANAHWKNPAEIINSAVESYKIYKWQNQEYRVEVWVEKDALIGVIENICRKMDVGCFSCRGYVSQSEMWNAAMRLINYTDRGHTPVIIHLGDHDPSGVDMTRDIRERLILFESNVEVVRIALNMPQIEDLQPPPNPAKITDSRCSGYIKKYGKQSWELDALEPSYLDNIIENTILGYRDEDRWEGMQEKENFERQKLINIAKGI